jgi:Mg-chelatase subunit ChlD
MGSLTVELKNAYSKVDFSKDTKNYVMLELKGGTAPSLQKRPPLDIIAVVDTSSSMGSAMKMENVKKSLRLMVEHMSPGDFLTLIEYDSEVRRSLSRTETDSRSKQTIFHAIGMMQPSGMTNFSIALGSALESARKTEGTSGSVRRIIFFTDGCPTSGNTSADYLIRFCKRPPTGWGITTMGYGLASDASANTDLILDSCGMGGEVNLSLLEKMAEAGEGNFYYMSDADTAARAFATELGGLITTVAQDIKIAVEAEPSRIEVTEILEDLDVQDTVDSLAVRVPDLMADETRFITLAVKCKKRGVPDELHAEAIARITVHFLDAVTGAVEEFQVSPAIQWVAPGLEDTQMNADVATQIALIEAISAQEEAYARAQAGDYAGAVALVNAATGALRQVGTARALSLAVCYNTVAETLKDKAAFLRGQPDYAASLYETKKGRAAGGAFMRFFSTITQERTQESFADHWDDEAEKGADGDENTMRRVGTANRSKTSRVPRY